MKINCSKCKHKTNCIIFIHKLEVDRCEIYSEEENTPMIKDSGERRQFYDAEGKPVAVRDMAEGKGRFDLMPWAALMEVAKHCENGSRKYGEHNVDKGLPTSSFADSGIRHLAKWLDGWTDEPHLISAAWNILWAIQTEIKHPELSNVPWKESVDDGKENQQ